MKSQSFNRIAKCALLVTVLATLSACGSSVKSRSGSDDSGGTGGGTSNSGNGIAECNEFSSKGIDQVSGAATTYYLNGSHVEDKLRLRLGSIPADFETSSTVSVKFFRWKASSAGVTSLDSTPLTFVVEKGTNGTYPISGAMTEIDKDDIDSLRSSGSVSGTTAQSFFDNTVLVLSGTNYDWDAVKVVVYDGTFVIAEADFLLPAFEADPNKYAAKHPSVLEKLHPFWSIRKNTNSQSQWEAKADALCF